MGATLARLAAADPRVTLLGGIDRDPADAEGYAVVRDLAGAAELIREADVLLDFSAPAFLARLLTERAGELRGRGVVIGTTGLGAEEE
jgi:dihydrodipicolinate reductase